MTENVIAQRRNNGKAKARSAASKALSYAFLILTAVVVLFPFYIALVTSFKTRVEAMNVEFTWWPKEFSLHGYKDVLTYKGSNAITIPLIVLGFLNTLWMVVPRSLISTVLAGMAAYAYAKLRFRAKNGMFGFLIATMMIPGVITLIPSYLMFYWLGWLTTPLPVILPPLLGGASCVFFMRQYYLGMPGEMVEAACLDGLGYFGIYFKIMFPIGMPAFWAQLVLALIGGYNEYLGPLLYLKNTNLYTLQLMLTQFSSSRSTDSAAVMASAMVALIPTVLVFVFAQKQFISGIVASGLKM